MASASPRLAPRTTLGAVRSADRLVLAHPRRAGLIGIVNQLKDWVAWIRQALPGRQEDPRELARPPRDRGERDSPSGSAGKPPTNGPTLRSPPRRLAHPAGSPASCTGSNMARSRTTAPEHAPRRPAAVCAIGSCTPVQQDAAHRQNESVGSWRGELPNHCRQWDLPLPAKQHV